MQEQKTEKAEKTKARKNPGDLPEIKNTREKLERITIHAEKHRQDKRAMRERERILALLRRQEQYHKIA